MSTPSPAGAPGDIDDVGDLRADDGAPREVR